MDLFEVITNAHMHDRAVVLPADDVSQLSTIVAGGLSEEIALHRTVKRSIYIGKGVTRLDVKINRSLRTPLLLAFTRCSSHVLLHICVVFRLKLGDIGFSGHVLDALVDR